MPDRLVGPSMLALITGQMAGPDLWRVLQPVTALERAGYPAGWDRNGNAAVGVVASQFDGYLLPRMSWPPEHRRMAERWFASIRQAGKIAVYDLDDDVLTSQETRRRVELDWLEGKTFERLEAERFERIWTLQQCDGVTVSTQRLATITRTFTDKPVHVVPNAIDTRWFRSVLRATKRQTKGLTIGWAGGRRHDRDVEPMAEAWGRIAARYPEVTIIVQGWVPEVIREHVPEERLVIIPWLPLERYPAGLAEVDIGCAAVADTPFNRCKSNIKVQEYGVANIAVVASPTLYDNVVEHGHSGFIAETVEEWDECLSRLIESPALRSMMATRLKRAVERKHALATNLWRWPAAWSRIAASARTGKLIAV